MPLTALQKSHLSNLCSFASFLSVSLYKDFSVIVEFEDRKDSIFRIQPTLIPHVSNTSFDLILNTCNECLMSFQSIGYIDPQLLTSNFKLLEDLAPYTLIELMKFAGSPLETIYLQIKKLVQGGSLLSCRAQEIFLYVKRTRQLYFSTIEVTNSGYYN